MALSSPYLALGFLFYSQEALLSLTYSGLEMLQSQMFRPFLPASSQVVSCPLLIPDICFLPAAPSLASVPVKADLTGSPFRLFLIFPNLSERNP